MSEPRVTVDNIYRAINRYRRMGGRGKPTVTMHPKDYVEMVKAGPRDLVNTLMLDYEIVSDPRVDRHLAELRPQGE